MPVESLAIALTGQETTRTLPKNKDLDAPHPALKLECRDTLTVMRTPR